MHPVAPVSSVPLSKLAELPNRDPDYFHLFKGLFLSIHTSEVQTISNIHIPGDYMGTCLTGCLADMSKQGKIYTMLSYRNNRRVSTLCASSGKETWTLLLKCFNIVDGIRQVTAVIPCC